MSAPELRAADVDRERIADRLRVAAGEGRLDAAELEERLERALSAQTYAELDALVGDLPQPARPHPSRARKRTELRAFVATSLLLVAIWALAGAGYFWPVWPILGWGLAVMGPPLVRLPPCRRNASWRPSTTR
jgi:hypothetical protein